VMTTVNATQTLPIVTVPLVKDEDGVWRFKGSRITLDTIVAFYNKGKTPEEIHEGFDTLSIKDIYAAIAYYLANKQVIDEYIKQADDEAEAILQRLAARRTPEQKARDVYFRQLAEEKRRANDALRG